MTVLSIIIRVSINTGIGRSTGSSSITVVIIIMWSRTARSDQAIGFIFSAVLAFPVLCNLTLCAFH